MRTFALFVYDINHKSVKLKHLILSRMIENSLLVKYGAIEKQYANSRSNWFKGRSSDQSAQKNG